MEVTKEQDSDTKTLKAQILERLVVDEEEPEVDEDASPLRDDVIDLHEFQEILDALRKALDQIDTLTRDLEELRSTGLAEKDLIALLYGRNPDLNKGTIHSVLRAIAKMKKNLDNPARHDRLLRALLADISGEGKRNTSAVLAGLKKIAARYGDVDE